MAHPFVPFFSAFTTSFTPRLTCFPLAAARGKPRGARLGLSPSCSLFCWGAWGDSSAGATWAVHQRTLLHHLQNLLRELRVGKRLGNRADGGGLLLPSRVIVVSAHPAALPVSGRGLARFAVCRFARGAAKGGPEVFGQARVLPRTRCSLRREICSFRLRPLLQTRSEHATTRRRCGAMDRAPFSAASRASSET